VNLKRHITWEPLYNIDPQTGAGVEIFLYLIVRSLRHSARMQDGSGGRASSVLPGACRLAHLPAVMPHTEIPRRTARRLLMPGDRAARPCRFFAPELSIIVHNFTHQVLDQLLSHSAVLLAS
jgi:hypothetical protein